MEKIDKQEKSDKEQLEEVKKQISEMKEKQRAISEKKLKLKDMMESIAKDESEHEQFVQLANKMSASNAAVIGIKKNTASNLFKEIEALESEINVGE